MSECAGFIGGFFGHNFEARYDYGKPTMGGEGPPSQLMELIEGSKPKKYCRDICTRCGEIKELTHSAE